MAYGHYYYSDTRAQIVSSYRSSLAPSGTGRRILLVPVTFGPVTIGISLKVTACNHSLLPLGSRRANTFLNFPLQKMRGRSPLGSPLCPLRIFKGT